MSILPLPQFEADLAAYEEDRKIYERLQPPKTMVVRFGSMRLVGEFPYKGDAKPGCGSKLVVRTHRGTELGEMLTSTCPNAGCSKSVSRKEMLEYIENSGGRDYPFFEAGEVLRVATTEDLNTQARLENEKKGLLMRAREIADPMGLDMRLIEAEPIIGGERLTFYFTSEDRVDFRDLLGLLAREFHTRIDLRQVGARDEARLIADYEKCGQHCCCKQFLKVLRPISMSAAKRQKHTLDPLKISGRCGRLMCCLRYEDSTYIELKQRLPNRKSRVITSEGPGTVIDSQVLTQLVLVALDSGTEIAVPVEELEKERHPGAKPADRDRSQDRDREDPIKASIRRAKQEERQRRMEDAGDLADAANTGTDEARREDQPLDADGQAPTKRRRRRRKKPADGSELQQQQQQTDQPRDDYQSEDRRTGDDRRDASYDGHPSQTSSPTSSPSPTDGPSTDRPRRKRRRRRDGQPPAAPHDAGPGIQDQRPDNRNNDADDQQPRDQHDQQDQQPEDQQQPRKKRRRRRRRPPGEEGPPAPPPPHPPLPPNPSESNT